MPPKPVPDELGSGPEFYNVDFTLQTQLRMATGAPPPPVSEWYIPHLHCKCIFEPLLKCFSHVCTNVTPPAPEKKEKTNKQKQNQVQKVPTVPSGTLEWYICLLDSVKILSTISTFFISLKITPPCNFIAQEDHTSPLQWFPDDYWKPAVVTVECMGTSLHVAKEPNL